MRLRLHRLPGVFAQLDARVRLAKRHPGGVGSNDMRRREEDGNAMRYLEQIERMAAARADACAVQVSTGEQLSYAELWRASEALASYIAERVAPGTPVVVYGNKHPLMVASFLACMKAGCPYVPVDCFSVPASRAASIVEQIAVALPADAAAAGPLMLAIEEFPQPEALPAARLVGRAALEDAVRAGGVSSRARWIAGEDLAYILFTSGSTGSPKGVEVTASCFDNFCAWDLELAAGALGSADVIPALLDADETTPSPFGDGNPAASSASGSGFGANETTPSPSDTNETTPSPNCAMVWVDQAPFSFDLSVFELAGALASGGTLFSLAHATQQSMAHQLEALAASRAGVWVSTPSFAELCLAAPEFSDALMPDLRLFLFCGETLPNATAARLLERFAAARVLNTYGPTESTVAVTSVEVTRELAAADAPLPVGAPRRGTRIRIVDETGADCAPGTFGEVIIEGDTVARGYFNRPDLTERAFGAAELGGEPCRTYRTGDEGMLDAAGMLHYRGRLDLQIKLNGFRIELGEIEEHLRRLPAVAAAAVVPAQRDGKIAHLVAHVVSAEPLTESPFRAGLAIKEQLKATLPHYMIPKKIVFAEALPMTGNGKVDRRALAAQGR